jgi:outer membrane protein assembly factor BamB
MGVHVHDGAHSSILIHGKFLYLNTSNGLNSTHPGVFSPDAPSLVVLDKTTGQLVARENENISSLIFHCTWSSPALGEVNGQNLVFFGGGDGVCYAFEALRSAPTSKKLKNIWRFDCDPNAPKENVHDYIRNRKVSPSNIKSTPVFHNNRVFITVGGDIWWGKHQAWLKCIDATKSGDITNSGQIWSYDLQRHCCSTPSIYKGLVFVADCGQYIHCVDINTGKPYWTHDTEGEIWASTLVADDKIYIGTRKRDFLVLAASKDKQVISSIKLDSPTTSTPVAANGVLYVATMKKLYALKKTTQ